MTEIRRVHYKLTGEGAPVIHLECRSAEEAQQAKRLAEAITDDEARTNYLNLLETFVRSTKPSKRLGIVYTPHQNAQTWSCAYIQCGPCKRAWDAWLSANPVDDDVDAWLEKAKKTILTNQWL